MKVFLQNCKEKLATGKASIFLTNKTIIQESNEIGSNNSFNYYRPLSLYVIKQNQ